MPRVRQGTPQTHGGGMSGLTVILWFYACLFAFLYAVWQTFAVIAQ